VIAEAPVRTTPRAAKPLRGRDKPRVAPPPPARSDAPAFRDVAKEMGIELMPWQVEAAKYLTARGPDNRRLYSEVCIVVARQQGKTTLMKPYIVQALRAGKKVLHIAQVRELPRIMFGIIADALSETPDLFPRRRGKIIWPRYGAGSEEIVLTNGGSYRIASATRGGARGHDVDLLIIDELREMDSWEVLAQAGPTLAMSPDPQSVYLSNAGTEASVILNSMRDRGVAGRDPTLAYLEWSAAPERALDDKDGWCEANPALGHFPQVERNLDDDFGKLPAPVFETERLCRWVVTLMPKLAVDATWQKARRSLPDVKQPAMGIAVDAETRRASAAVAWMANGACYVWHFAEAGPAEPIEVDAFAADLQPLVAQHRIREDQIGFDPYWDRALARHFPKAKSITGTEWMAACKNFAALLDGGQLHHDDAGVLTADLAYTVRRETSNGWFAVPASAERPTTASLAMIRAVWLATNPSQPKPKVF
jgi:hypothetical protein